LNASFVFVCVFNGLKKKDDPIKQFEFFAILSIQEGSILT
jgi:hypothetical protein